MRSANEAFPETHKIVKWCSVFTRDEHVNEGTGSGPLFRPCRQNTLSREYTRHPYSSIPSYPKAVIGRRFIYILKEIDQPVALSKVMLAPYKSRVWFCKAPEDDVVLFPFQMIGTPKPM